jgi:hypothetical protein
MYQFIKISTGWRVFWGIEPRSEEAEADQDATGEENESGPTILPLRQPEYQPGDHPAA